MKKLCAYSDKYSYDIYLVHQFAILGPFSLMSLTGNLGINLVLILIMIVLCAAVVNFISTNIKKKLKMSLGL